MQKKPLVYVETTVISYYVSRQSKSLIVRSNQEITKKWWRRAGDLFTPLISTEVLSEISQGDALLAARRFEAIQHWPVLAPTRAIATLAKSYLAKTALPEKAERDAIHIAFATVHEIDFLATWNCTHIANAFHIKRIQYINWDHGYSTPVICTPQEMLSDEQHGA